MRDDRPRCEEDTVSIPYRYATNTWQAGVTRAGDAFQSLIGTLQTKCGNNCRRAGDRVSIPYRYATNSSVRSSASGRFSVSIPYRYATNLLPNLSKGKKILVSIPYRYATNYLFFIRDVFKEVSFNPLQVRYKRGFCRPPKALLYCFNPLQVRYKHILGKYLCILPRQFQSLIGTLQTRR